MIQQDRPVSGQPLPGCRNPDEWLWDCDPIGIHIYHDLLLA
jgi:hypothetical protein